MRVLSLFDGIACARVALDRAGVPVTSYSASEIDPHAAAISRRQHPTIVQLGDVRTLQIPPGSIDLLIGGSPCQDLSIAKTGRQGLAGDRSSLFWEYVRLLRSSTPRWFLLENVASMSKADKASITEALGVEPILLDAALVSAQVRKRLFWTNIPQAGLPADRGIRLTDILEPEAADWIPLPPTMSLPDGGAHGSVAIGRVELRRLDEAGVRHDGDTRFPIVKKITARPSEKSNTLTSMPEHNLIIPLPVSDPVRIRKLTPLECERLQGLPDGYTEGISKTQRYKALGNAFNVDVIAHLLSPIRTLN